jgi:S1-C subfamily serine protease
MAGGFNLKAKCTCSAVQIALILISCSLLGGARGAVRKPNSKIVTAEDLGMGAVSEPIIKNVIVDAVREPNRKIVTAEDLGMGAVRESNRKTEIATDDSSLDSFGHHTKPTLNSLKRSVFRITVYKRVFRWGRPFDGHYVVGSLGSGFLISVDPMIICTCAHVVNGAEAVYVQVTEFGKAKFAARVQTINNYVDAALVTLEDPKAFMDKLATRKVSLQPLRFANKSPKLGHGVVAPGFPLGQESMTLSTGVISGTDHVSFHYTNLAIQSTAIISPGNSGSPLLDGDTLEVIGMNYAKKTSEAQINYVVALWRLKQVFVKHMQIYAGKTEPPKELHQFRLVEHGLVLTPGVDALYLMAKGNKTCKSGPLLSYIQPTSPFKEADPPVPSQSFLVSVDGVKLDSYGQGAKKEYADELVNFADLMWMRGGTGEEEIKFETCNAETGETQSHTTSMAWSKDRQGLGIQYHYDPRLDKVDWEIFGDLIFMELSENHISQFGGDFHNAAMIRFLEPVERQKPRLAVMLLESGGEAQDALGLMKGRDLEIVESINGHSVGTLEEFRQHFVPGKPRKIPQGGASSGLKFLQRSKHPTRDVEDLVGKTKAYLPKHIHGVTVLDKVAGDKWQATNRFLHADADGLVYRWKKRLDAQMEKGILDWGETIGGIDDGGGWVEIHISTQVAPAASKVAVPVEDKNKGSTKETSLRVPSRAIPQAARPTVGDTVVIRKTDSTESRCPQIIGQMVKIVENFKDERPYKVEGCVLYLFESDVEMEAGEKKRKKVAEEKANTDAEAEALRIREVAKAEDERAKAKAAKAMQAKEEQAEATRKAAEEKKVAQKKLAHEQATKINTTAIEVNEKNTSSGELGQVVHLTLKDEARQTKATQKVETLRKAAQKKVSLDGQVAQAEAEHQATQKVETLRKAAQKKVSLDGQVAQAEAEHQGLDIEEIAEAESQSRESAILQHEFQEVRDGDEMVWSLKTEVGKEYATLFMQTLQSQAQRYLQGRQYVMTSAAKKAMLDLGWFKGKKKSLLATPQAATLNSVDFDSTVELHGEPLEEVRRMDDTSIVDFATNMRNDIW